MFEFLHAADIHLDSPLRGLQRYEGAPAETIRLASRRAMQNLIDIAVRDKVAFVLIAGDLYDGDWKDYNTGLFFVQQMTSLRDANIPVVLLAGNHDAANKMTRLLRLPDNVTTLPVDQPGTVDLPQFGVSIHGQGFMQANVTDDLSARYPKRRDGCFNIGMLHTCATGAEGHERYAPCTVEGLRAKGYDYWALGHVHKRTILCEDPLIVFPGNIQGRRISESGAKGCMRVRVDKSGRPTAEFQSLDVLRWDTCLVDVGMRASADAIIDAVADELRLLCLSHDLPIAVHVQVTGATPAHLRLTSDPARWTNEVRARALADFAERVWIEQVDWQTRPPRPDTLLPDRGPIGELHQLLADLRTDDDAWRDFLNECKDLDALRTKVPTEVADGVSGFSLRDPASLRQVLGQVESLLHRRLVGLEDQT